MGLPKIQLQCRDYIVQGVVRQYCLHLCTCNLFACFITQVPGQHV